MVPFGRLAAVMDPCSLKPEMFGCPSIGGEYFSSTCTPCSIVVHVVHPLLVEEVSSISRAILYSVGIVGVVGGSGGRGVSAGRRGAIE